MRDPRWAPFTWGAQIVHYNAVSYENFMLGETPGLDYGGVWWRLVTAQESSWRTGPDLFRIELAQCWSEASLRSVVWSLRSLTFEQVRHVSKAVLERAPGQVCSQELAESFLMEHEL